MNILPNTGSVMFTGSDMFFFSHIASYILSETTVILIFTNEHTLKSHCSFTMAFLLS